MTKAKRNPIPTSFNDADDWNEAPDWIPKELRANTFNNSFILRMINQLQKIHLLGSLVPRTSSVLPLAISLPPLMIAILLHNFFRHVQDMGRKKMALLETQLVHDLL